MKIVIGGESFDYDTSKRPMSEALAIEEAWGRRYAEWEAELQAGSAQAMAVLVWTVLRREGREVALADILSGEVDFDYHEVMRSVADYAREQEAAAEDPTSGASPRTDPDGTATTSAATPGRSARSSGSARGKSGS